MPRRPCRRSNRILRGSSQIRVRDAAASSSTSATPAAATTTQSPTTVPIVPPTAEDDRQVPPGRQFQYTPKTKYQHSHFDENGVYWPSTRKRRRKTPAEKAVAAAEEKRKKKESESRLVEGHMRRAEVFFLWENGGITVDRNNKTSIAKFIIRKYPNYYTNLGSAVKYVRRTLDGIKKKWYEDNSKNPLRDGRTTAKQPSRVSSNAELRRAVEERLPTTSCRQLARGTTHVTIYLCSHHMSHHPHVCPYHHQ